MKTLRHICILLVCLAALSSCGVTKHIPQGKYLVTKNDVEVDKDKNLSRKENTPPTELERYIRQKPNKRLLGTNFYLWAYNKAKPEKKNWWNNLLRRMGEEPVFLDTTLTTRSAADMGLYMNNRGLLNATTEWSVDTSRRRRARILYHATQGAPYRIGKISYDFRDKFLQPIILADTLSRAIRTGDMFDVSLLDAERVRITSMLRNQGYYHFNINNISYMADSTVGGRKVDITLVVKQFVTGFNDKGEPLSDNNVIYRLKEIYVHPGYDPVAINADTAYRSRLDTVSYRELNIVYDGKPKVRPEIMRRTINLYPNQIYNADEVKLTYDKIMRLGYYKSASILFTEVKDTTDTRDNFITFIGRDGTATGAEQTKERYLICSILCTPAQRQSYKIELEATTSSNYYGIIATVGYQNRNIFRGVELLDVSVRGGYEFMRVKGSENSFEIGGAVSLSFPRFITPFRVDRYNRLINPRTKVELSYDIQNRPYYHRTLSSGTWGYSWSNAKYSSFILKPIDISIVKLSYIDQEFLNSLQNLYLRNSYTSQIIAGLSGSYIFNNQRKGLKRNSIAFRVNAETNGNLIDGLASAFLSKRSDEDYYRVFGIRFAQYFRVDANIAHHIPIKEKSALVYRFYIGSGYAYGNSTSLPFERLFYCGGANSMRGWQARTLGPGSSPKPTDAVYPSQLGTFKMEANVEGRFPVWGLIQGAVFFDVGNIWFLQFDSGESNPDEIFKFNNFYKQLGFNTGLGIRLDFNFFIFRVDWGIKLHDPNMPLGQRWINKFEWNETALSFGVGYPF